MLFFQRSVFFEVTEKTTGMRCPLCGHAVTQVIDTRMLEEGNTMRRRRRCKSCDRRLTTYERTELFFPAAVKKNGSRVDYDRNKVKDSTCLALRKRPVFAETIDEVIARIEEKLPSHGGKKIDSDRVGKLVMCGLKRLGKIGHIRLASVYRSFEDLVELRNVLDEVATMNVRK